jgi:hypothetical protein
MHTDFLWENLKETDHMEYLCIVRLQKQLKKTKCQTWIVHLYCIYYVYFRSN